MVSISSFSLVSKELIVRQAQLSTSEVGFLVLCFIVTGVCSMLVFRAEDTLLWIVTSAVGTGAVCTLVAYGFMAMIKHDTRRPLRRKSKRVR